MLHADPPQLQRRSYKVVSDVITSWRKEMWMCSCASHRFFPIEYTNLKPPYVQPNTTVGKTGY